MTARTTATATASSTKTIAVATMRAERGRIISDPPRPRIGVYRKKDRQEEHQERAAHRVDGADRRGDDEDRPRQPRGATIEGKHAWRFLRGKRRTDGVRGGGGSHSQTRGGKVIL